MSKEFDEAHADILPEYDFSNAVRGKYAARYSENSNIIVLEPDVAEVFQNEIEVNTILRALIAAMPKHASV